MLFMPFSRISSVKSKAFTNFAVSCLTLAIGQAYAQAPAQPPVQTLAPVEVVGRSTQGNYLESQVSGNKTSLDNFSTPQSIRTMTRQSIDDLGATKLDDVLDFVGGVSRQNNFGGLWDNIAIRGLPGNENTGASILLNGFSSNRGFNAPRDLAGVEKVEFLRGPVTSLFGSAEAGGMLNIVSKSALWRSAHAVEAYVGSFGLKRIALDTNTPLKLSTASDPSAFALRLNLAIEKSDGFRDFVASDRLAIAPTFTWQIGESSSIKYYGELLEQSTPLDRGVVAVNNVLGAIPVTRFLGESADGAVKVRNQTHQILGQWALSSLLELRTNLAFKKTSLKGFSTEATALQADNQTLRRQRRFRDYQSEDTALQLELATRANNANQVFQWLVGTETYRFKQDNIMLRINPSASAPYAINILNPVYGQAQPTPSPNTSTLENQSANALYGQIVVKPVDGVHLIAGTRADRVEQSLLNRRTLRETIGKPSATSSRLGASWSPQPQWSIYANWGQSFRPNSGLSFQGAEFKPESGVSSEAGVKWETADKRLGLSVAAFNITKKNVLTADPSNAGFSIAAGKLSSRGLEFDLAGRISQQWRISSSALINDVAIKADNTLEVGGRLLNVPRVNASALVFYDGVFNGDIRYSIGAGVTHTGKRLGEARTQVQANANAVVFELPAYTKAKLSGNVQITPMVRVTLDVDNVFNTDHYTSSFSRVWVTPGASRTITLGAQFKF